MLLISHKEESQFVNFLRTKRTNIILLNHSINVDSPCRQVFLQVNGFTLGIQFAEVLKSKSTNRILLKHVLKSVSCQRKWRTKVSIITHINRGVIAMTLRIAYLPGAFTFTSI
jgi:hypothetical protein